MIKEYWNTLSENDQFELYKKMQNWCKFYSWVYYNNNGNVPGINTVSDQEYDTMYNRILYMEEEFPNFISKLGGSVTEYVGDAICTFGGKTDVPIKAPLINKKYFEK